MDGVENETRLEILRQLVEFARPVGADSLLERMASRGIRMTVDGLRYHLRILDEQGHTMRVGRQGRLITEIGRRELSRSLVDTRIRQGLARAESAAQQVTLNPSTGRGLVACSVATCPRESIADVAEGVRAAFSGGVCTFNRLALLTNPAAQAGEDAANDHANIAILSTATIDGLLLSQGLVFRPTFGGIVEYGNHRPYRFVDVVDYGLSSLDPVEILMKSARLQVRSTLDHGRGFVLADVREMIGSVRERVVQTLDGIQRLGLNGVIAIGEVGQPILGIPVRRHMFGVAIAVGANCLFPLFEAGVEVQISVNELLVEFSQLTSSDVEIPHVTAVPVR